MNDNKLVPTFIPAFPGFEAGTFMDPDENNPASFWWEPVVAWLVTPEKLPPSKYNPDPDWFIGSPTPLTPEGKHAGLWIKYPDGRINQTSNTDYPNEAAALEAAVAEWKDKEEKQAEERRRADVSTVIPSSQTIPG